MSRQQSVTDSHSATPQTELEVATLAGGCFWCLDAVYRRLRGVHQVVSGFTGGHVRAPSYEMVTYGGTGHAEAVQIHYDPRVIAYRELLEIFFVIHDPTSLNRQGADVGPEYRSAIFFHNPAQEHAARQMIAELTEARLWPNRIVTEVTPAGGFYPAEEYHQRYYERNPDQAYCAFVIAPKVAKLRQYYLEKLK